jgi:hypothetical protein
MKTYMKWIMVLLIIGLFSAFPALAQDEAAGASTFVGRPTLWIAIIIGLVATAATGVYAYQLKGGVVGTALTFIGIGMFLVVLGFLAVVVEWTQDGNLQMAVHDIVFIIGYVLMLVGALRLKQMIR